MSDSTDQPRDYHDRAGESPVSVRNLRVWPALVMLAIFWTFLLANHTVGLSMFARFSSRMTAYGVLLLLFSIWWLSRSTIGWRDRLLAIVVAIGIGTVACLVADQSMNGFAFFLTSFPVVVTVWTVWLWIARSLSPTVQRAGFCLAMLLVFGYFTLIRWDGLDAMQRMESSWRWQPTSEQKFFATRNATDASAAEKESGVAKPWTPQPGDWLELRGANRDGVVKEVQLAADWNENPPQALWRKRVGPAWSGMIVVDGHLVTQEQRGDVEAVVCYDVATGHEIWAHEDVVRFEEALSGAGPRSTPTFADGHIYTLGAKGKLNCLVAENGEVAWSHDIAADAEATTTEIPQWGYSVSPLIVDGLVIIFAGGSKGKSILAYRAVDGELAWSRAGGKQSYSSPQLVTLNGQRQVVMHDNVAIRGVNIADGSPLWEHPNASELSVPMLQPHQASQTELVISTEPGLASLEAINDGGNWSITQRWATNALRASFNDFVIHNYRIYGMDDGILCCVDLATGKRLWKKGRFGHGQILLLPDQDQLLLSSDKGQIILVSVDRQGFKELGRFQAVEGKTWNGPVLVGNRLFLRSNEEMAAYKLNAHDVSRVVGMTED